MSRHQQTLHRQPRQQPPSSRKLRSQKNQPSTTTTEDFAELGSHTAPTLRGAASPPIDSDDSDTESFHDHNQSNRQPQCARGLPRPVQIELLVDIEATGGIQHASVGRIVNSKPEVYGNINSSRRKQCENIFYNDWKKLSPTAYLQLLSSLGVPASSQLSYVHTPLSPLPNISTIVDVASPTRSIVPPPPAVTPTPFVTSPSFKMSHTTDLACRDTTTVIEDTIHVNLAHPERNREVFIFPFENLRNNTTGEICNGFEIVLPADIRDVEKDLYRAEIVDCHNLVITMPSMPHQLLHDCALRHTFLSKMAIGCPRCKEAQEITMMEINASSTRKERKLRLRFPEDITLVNMESALDKVLTNNEQPYQVRMNALSNNRVAIFCNMTWKVGRQESIRKAPGSAARTTTTKLSALFQRMTAEESSAQTAMNIGSTSAAVASCTPHSSVTSVCHDNVPGPQQPQTPNNSAPILRRRLAPWQRSEAPSGWTAHPKPSATSNASPVISSNPIAPRSPTTSNHLLRREHVQHVDISIPSPPSSIATQMHEKVTTAQSAVASDRQTPVLAPACAPSAAKCGDTKSSTMPSPRVCQLSSMTAHSTVHSTQVELHLGATPTPTRATTPTMSFPSVSESATLAAQLAVHSNQATHIVSTCAFPNESTILPPTSVCQFASMAVQPTVQPTQRTRFAAKSRNHTKHPRGHGNKVTIRNRTTKQASSNDQTQSSEQLSTPFADSSALAVSNVDTVSAAMAYFSSPVGWTGGPFPLTEVHPHTSMTSQAMSYFARARTRLDWERCLAMERRRDGEIVSIPSNTSNVHLTEAKDSKQNETSPDSSL